MRAVYENGYESGYESRRMGRRADYKTFAESHHSPFTFIFAQRCAAVLAALLLPASFTQTLALAKSLANYVICWHRAKRGNSSTAAHFSPHK